MPKFNIKFLSHTLLFTFILAAFVTVLINGILFLAKPAILRRINDNLTLEVSARNIFFSPPNYLILKHASLSDRNSTSQMPLIKTKTVFSKFSIFDLLTKHIVSSSQIILYRPIIAYSLGNEKSGFPLKDELTEFLKHAPHLNTLIKLSRAQFPITLKNDPSNFAVADIVIELKDNNFAGSGSIIMKTILLSANELNRPDIFSDSSTLQFTLNGIKTPEGYFLQNLKLTQDRFNANLWGSLNNNKLQLKGYSLLQLNDNPQKILINNRNRSFLPALTKQSASKGLSHVDLYFLDIESLLTLSLNRIDINYFNFSINNNPVTVQGHFVFDDDISFQISSAIAKNKTSAVNTLGFDKIQLETTGFLQESIINSDVQLKVMLPQKTGSRLPFKEISTSLTGLRANLLSLKSIIGTMGKVQFDFYANSTTQSILLSNLRFRTNITENKLFPIFINSSFYDGNLQGKLTIPPSQTANNITSRVKLDNISAKQLSSAVAFLPEMDGKISALIRVDHTPSLKLSGKASIDNGQFKDLEFLNWLADYFDLPTLRNIEFEQASLQFSSTAQDSQLENIQVIAKDLAVNGYFHLGENDLVNSKVSFLFKRDLLKQSKKLKSLTKLISEEIDPLDFSFKLSGNLNTLNFQWLYSDFKKSLEEKIPGRYQRKIEQGIEEIIAPNNNEPSDQELLEHPNLVQK